MIIKRWRDITGKLFGSIEFKWSLLWILLLLSSVWGLLGLVGLFSILMHRW